MTKKEIHALSDKKLLERVIKDARALGGGEIAKVYGKRYGAEVKVLGLENSELYVRELRRRLRERKQLEEDRDAWRCACRP